MSPATATAVATILVTFGALVIVGMIFTVAVIDRHDKRRYAEHEQAMSAISEEQDEPTRPDTQA